MSTIIFKKATVSLKNKRIEGHLKLKKKTPHPKLLPNSVKSQSVIFLQKPQPNDFFIFYSSLKAPTDRSSRYVTNVNDRETAWKEVIMTVGWGGGCT